VQSWSLHGKITFLCLQLDICFVFLCLDAMTVIGFLKHFGLDKDFKVRFLSVLFVFVYKVDLELMFVLI